MYPPGLPLPTGQSLAHITIGLAGLVICDLSPTMSCQWASVSSGLWCSSDSVPILCRFARPALPRHLRRCTVCDTAREIALVHSASLAYEDGSVFMSMAHGTGYGTKVIKSTTCTTRRHQRDSMTITMRIKEDFGCETHHGQPNARHPASTMSGGQHP